MKRFILVAALVLVIGATAAWFFLPINGRTQWEQWQGKRTVLRLANALETRDSAALAELSARGSAHNLLCAADMWSPAYFRPGEQGLKVLWRYARNDSLEYRWVGDLLPHGRPTSIIIGIPRYATDKVSYISPEPNTVFTEALLSCLEP